MNNEEKYLYKYKKILFHRFRIIYYNKIKLKEMN